MTSGQSKIRLTITALALLTAVGRRVSPSGQEGNVYGFITPVLTVSVPERFERFFFYAGPITIVFLCAPIMLLGTGSKKIAGSSVSAEQSKYKFPYC